MTGHTFDPQLRAARFLPRTIITARTLPVLRVLTKLTRKRPDAQVVAVDTDVSVHVFRPTSAGPQRTPALLWIHGGGMVLGDAAQDSTFCRRVADELNIVVVSVEYRLAPEHPFPTPLEDCYTALQWLARQPDIDPRRLRIWSPASNRFGWRSYLGPATTVPPLAAPARYDDLSGLPPAWIGIGTDDLFHDETVIYARRLQQAGVACTLHVVPGAYHNFDSIEPKAAISQAFVKAQINALDQALNGD